jgi:hypothetical protein
MTHPEAARLVRERWERLGLNPESAPTVFGSDVDNMLAESGEAINQALEVAPNAPQTSEVSHEGRNAVVVGVKPGAGCGVKSPAAPQVLDGAPHDQETTKEADVLGRSVSAVAERLQEGTATISNQALTTYHTSRGGNSDGLRVAQVAANESDQLPAIELDEAQTRNTRVSQTDMPRNDAVTADESSASAGIHSSLDHFTNRITRCVDKKLGRETERFA